MSKCVKIWFMVAASLVLLGIFLLGGVLLMVRFDFGSFSTGRYETNRYEITDAYSDIMLHTNTADVEFVPSQNGKTEIVCYEQTHAEHAVAVKDGTLVIERVDTRKWYEHLQIGSLSTKITVSLPAGEYGALSMNISTGDIEIPKEFSFASLDIKGSTGDVDCEASVVGLLKIKLSTGDIEMGSLSAGAMDLAVTTGKIEVRGVTCVGDVHIGVSTGKAYLTDVTCKNLTSDGDTGDLSLTNVIASEKFSIKRSTGDVTFASCDAAELCVETDTGDVKGSLRSDKIFLVHTDTGHVEVPDSVVGGRCRITTDTGDIKMQISS